MSPRKHPWAHSVLGSQAVTASQGKEASHVELLGAISPSVAGFLVENSSDMHVFDREEAIRRINRFDGTSTRQDDRNVAALPVVSGCNCQRVDQCNGDRNIHPCVTRLHKIFNSGLTFAGDAAVGLLGRGGRNRGEENCQGK
jgi:hypothetical protein